MTTFGFQQVRDYAAGVNAELDRCDNGEGGFCDMMDQALELYASRCCTFTNDVRRWARDVFAGRVAFDPGAEQLWKAELVQLYERATKVASMGGEIEEPCFQLSGLNKLRAALWGMNQLITGWVTPRLSVAPAARQGFPADLADEARRRIATLPPLPAAGPPPDGRRIRAS